MVHDNMHVIKAVAAGAETLPHPTATMPPKFMDLLDRCRAIVRQVVEQELERLRS